MTDATGQDDSAFAYGEVRKALITEVRTLHPVQADIYQRGILKPQVAGTIHCLPPHNQVASGKGLS